MVAATVAAELADFVVECAELPGEEKLFDAHVERIGRVIVPEVKAILAAGGPFGRDAKRFTHLGACALGDDFHSRITADLAALGGAPLATARAGGKTLANRFDQRAANLPIRDRISGNIHLQKAH